MKIRTAAISAAVPLVVGASIAAPVVSGVATAESDNIVQVAASNKNFSTLVTAVKAAGLVNTLSSGSWTVFAPTNAAFARVPKAVLDKLLEPVNKAALVRVLTYHVVAGSHDAAYVIKHAKLRTVEGQSISVRVKNGSVYLNGSTKVIQADIAASNGYIHVINKVLIPTGLHLH